MDLRKSLIGLLVSANLTGCCLVNDKYTFNPLKNYENNQDNSIPKSYFKQENYNLNLFEDYIDPENPVEFLPPLEINPKENIIPDKIPEENNKLEELLKELPDYRFVRY